jgi:hypothetical protein
MAGPVVTQVYGVTHRGTVEETVNHARNAQQADLVWLRPQHRPGDLVNDRLQDCNRILHAVLLHRTMTRTDWHLSSTAGVYLQFYKLCRRKGDFCMCACCLFFKGFIFNLLSGL